MKTCLQTSVLGYVVLIGWWRWSLDVTLLGVRLRELTLLWGLRSEGGVSAI